MFLQDRITFRNWSIQAGIRWDGYHLIVDDHAWSPPFAVVWHSDGAKLSVHACMIRVFQTPASENLLLSSSFAALISPRKPLDCPFCHLMQTFLRSVRPRCWGTMCG